MSESTRRLFEQMSLVLDFKASPPPGPFKFAMLFDLSRSLEPLPELLRGRGWCDLQGVVPDRALCLSTMPCRVTPKEREREREREREKFIDNQ